MLIRTRTAFGGFDIRDDVPRLTVIRNAMVIGWALYDDRRLLVPDSPFTREGLQSGRLGLTTIGAESTTNRNIRVGQVMPDTEEYVWIGHMHEHFGHFLISTVSRLWSILRQAPNAKLVTPWSGQLQKTLALPFVTTIFDALGITADRVIAVPDGTIFPSIAVPEALLVENSAAHTEFSRFAIELAERIAGPDDTRDRDGRPLFLSKHRLQGGVRTIDGEAEFAAVLERAGVVVASPETLTLAEQIRLWRRHPLIMSFEGSAGHNAIFVRNKKLLSLSSNSFAPSNQVLIDTVADHQCLYLNCSDDFAVGEQRPGFDSALRLTDPPVTAGAALRAITYLQNTNDCMRLRRMEDTLSSSLYLDEPFGHNLSRGRPTQMSSADPAWSRNDGDTAQQARGAVSGRLSATYQFHTGPDDQPWWQVDLEQRCLVTEIRIYNRNDDARERARHLILSSSNDGNIWRKLTRREQTDDYGGDPNRTPWRWWSDRPFETRFIRVSLEGRDFLHLDQVEVFGLKLAERTPTFF